jgi:hypothetical protein
MPSTTKRPDPPTAKRRSSANEAWLPEPDVKGCRPSSQWRLRFLQSQLTKKFELEITFRTREGKQALLRLDNSRRSDVDWIRKELDSRNARLPNDKKDAVDFVSELIRRTPTHPVVAYTSPGWTSDAKGFVMPYKRYGNAAGRCVWDSQMAPREFARIRGDLKEYQKTVLRLAEESPYVSAAVMIALAGPLIDYVKIKREVELLPETAIFHFAAESSTGKTTLARVAQSVFGSPDIEADYEASDRGISEHAYQRNNLAMIIDDTESSGSEELEIWAAMQKLAQRFPRGRSKVISGRSARSDLPALRWSCNAISTGPETIAHMATRLRRSRKGDRVRILDIKLPSLDDGGVFGSRVTANRKPAADSASLTEMLEKWLPKCHGVLFDAWIDYLIEFDSSPRLIECVEEFVAAMASGANGLEQRFAKKFAILYAAGQVGVESGLLPWPVDWPMRAVRHCYENSLNERDPDVAATTKAVRLLAKSLNSKGSFPKFVVQRAHYPLWRDDQIGFHRVNAGRCETLIAKERLDHVCDDFVVESAVFRRLLELKVVGRGTYASASEQLRVRSPKGDIVKIRFWRLDAEALRRWATSIAPRQTAGGAQKPGLNRSRITLNSSTVRSVLSSSAAAPRR